MINIKGYEVKNLNNELLIKDFEHITMLFNDKEKMFFEKWAEIFIYLGVPEEVVDNFDVDDFIIGIKDFNDVSDQKNINIIKDITIDGVEYSCYDENFKITVKDMSLIEEYAKKNENRYLGDVMAVLYKRVDADKNVNYDKSHIHYKAELFRKEITIDKLVPILNILSNKLIKEVTNFE